MKIRLLSVMVADQEKALQFYTGILGFVKKTEVPIGDMRWLTVVSPQEPDGPEVVLEPLGFAPAKTFQEELYKAGIPAVAFSVDDVYAEHARLEALGVSFSMKPTQMGAALLAVFDDTCGNRIQIFKVV